MGYNEIINTGCFFDSYVSFLVFNFIHKCLNRFMERKMSNNFAALFHAYGLTTLSFSYILSNNSTLWYFLTKFSTGYFLYDIRQIIKYNKISQLDCAYLYHHLASIYFIHQDRHLYDIANVFFWSELSNIPSYFVYFYMKQKNINGEKLRLLKKIQFYIYSLIRFPIVTFILIKNYCEVENVKPIYPVIPIYLMGLIWTNQLRKQLK